jgi:hypothetical protein
MRIGREDGDSPVSTISIWQRRRQRRRKATLRRKLRDREAKAPPEKSVAGAAVACHTDGSIKGCPFSSARHPPRRWDCQLGERYTGSGVSDPARLHHVHLEKKAAQMAFFSYLSQ